MPPTIVRVKRRREDASAARVVLESEETRAEGDGRDAMRARAAALASALDAVLDGGSAATPYGAYAGASAVDGGVGAVGGGRTGSAGGGSGGGASASPWACSSETRTR